MLVSYGEYTPSESTLDGGILHLRYENHIPMINRNIRVVVEITEPSPLVLFRGFFDSGEGTIFAFFRPYVAYIFPDRKMERINQKPRMVAMV